MILKCVTNDFPKRITYGKSYEVITEVITEPSLFSKGEKNYYIIDNNNKFAVITTDSFNKKYFIDIVDWRKNQIDRLLSL